MFAGYSCRLSFYYHMYGEHMGDSALSVKIKRVNQEQQWDTVWTHTVKENAGADQHNRWIRHEISLKRFQSAGVLQAKIVAKRGSGAAADIALDDVSLICGQRHSEEADTVGSCMCDGGYDGDGEVGGTGCTLSENITKATTAAPVSTVDYKDTCDGSTDKCGGNEDFVCDTSTRATWKNTACASKCLGGNPLLVKGVCSEDSVDTCAASATTEQQTMCVTFAKAGGANYVCGDDEVTYGSAYCAECNQQLNYRRGICNAPFVHKPCR